MKRRGFTTLELIISISIFVFLTTVTVFSFRGVGLANSIRSNGAILASGLRRAQSYAVSGSVVKVCSDYTTTAPRLCGTTAECGLFTCESVVPTGGYGVVLTSANATTFSVFADLNNNGSYSAANDVIVPAGTVTLTDRTQISNPGTFPQSVVFGAKRGVVSFVPAGGNGGSNTQYFCVRHPSLTTAFTGRYRKVIVNGITGLIDDTSTATCP